MIRILRGRVVLAASLLVVVLVGGCVTKEAEQDIAWRESVSPRLVAPEVLMAAGLEVVWENKLPIKEKESLDRFFILDNLSSILAHKDSLAFPLLNIFIGFNAESPYASFLDANIS